jgi:hypothetical protein
MPAATVVETRAGSADESSRHLEGRGATSGEGGKLRFRTAARIRGDSSATPRRAHADASISARWMLYPSRLREDSQASIDGVASFRRRSALLE